MKYGYYKLIVEFKVYFDQVPKFYLRYIIHNKSENKWVKKKFSLSTIHINQLFPLIILKQWSKLPFQTQFTNRLS